VTPAAKDTKQHLKTKIRQQPENRTPAASSSQQTEKSQIIKKHSFVEVWQTRTNVLPL
jgi:hypothetical protein